MASATDERTENYRDSDRRTLAGWDRQDAMERWMEATVEMQRTYLEWVQKGLRVFVPQFTERTN